MEKLKIHKKNEKLSKWFEQHFSQNEEKLKEKTPVKFTELSWPLFRAAICAQLTDFAVTLLIT